AAGPCHRPTRRRAPVHRRDRLWAGGPERERPRGRGDPGSRGHAQRPGRALPGLDHARRRARPRLHPARSGRRAGEHARAARAPRHRHLPVHDLRGELPGSGATDQDRARSPGPGRPRARGRGQPRDRHPGERQPLPRRAGHGRAHGHRPREPSGARAGLEGVRNPAAARRRRAPGADRPDRRERVSARWLSARPAHAGAARRRRAHAARRGAGGRGREV
ncbi:MAG: hypothetical protein AVDCRST_MAG17-55, partial [uncultured Solirubrobacterales bacterium]